MTSIGLRERKKAEPGASAPGLVGDSAAQADAWSRNFRAGSRKVGTESGRGRLCPPLF